MEPKIKYRKPKSFRNDVIATVNATGEILQFWNALLVGDDITIISVIDDPEYTNLIDAVYDTSDIDEWKNYRFNYRVLSMFTDIEVFFFMCVFCVSTIGLSSIDKASIYN